MSYEPDEKILSVILSLALVCGAFGILPSAAQEAPVFEAEDGTYVPNEVVVLFKNGAVGDSVPGKSELASTGANFGDGMRAVSSEDAALSAVSDEKRIIADSLGDDFALEDTLVFSPDGAQADCLAPTGASAGASADAGVTVALVSSEKYGVSEMIEKLSRNGNVAAVEPSDNNGEGA